MPESDQSAACVLLDERPVNLDQTTRKPSAMMLELSQSLNTAFMVVDSCDLALLRRWTAC